MFGLILFHPERLLPFLGSTVNGKKNFEMKRYIGALEIPYGRYPELGDTRPHS
jgi:hypothetical protein